MNKKCLRFEKIFSLPILSSSKEDLLTYVAKTVKEDKKKEHLFIVTPNSEFIIASKKDRRFLNVLKKADIAIPDGIGLVWGRRVLAEKGFFKKLMLGFWVGLKVLRGELADEVITGTDLMEDICRLAAKRSETVYLLGAKPGVAKKALAVLKNRYPGLRGWAASGPNPTPGVSADFTPGVNWVWIQKINQKKPTFLFVALGMKKQEEFIWGNWDRLNVGLAMGVGGAFDFISGEVNRAPIGWRRLGLEWLYRLYYQPWRWRKQLALIKFIWLVLGYKGV